MKYTQLIATAKALLIGDNMFPTDKEQQLALLAYAFNKVATEADALKLFTFNVEERILRQGPGSMYVRNVNLPTDPDKFDHNMIVDIDDELCYPVARYLASFISRDKAAIHAAEAQALIRAYNSKVEAYMMTLDQRGQLDDIR